MQIAREVLLRSYRAMRTIRDFEERLHVEFATGEIPGFVHLYCGEEASGVGVCAHLTDTDTIASTHRGHGHCIAKGVGVDGMMAEIYGKKTGLCRGKGGSMHIADLSLGMLGANGIVGGGPPLICGAALSHKLLKDNGVAVAFYGDGASNEGSTLESLNLATVWNLPAVFVLEDNGYGEATASSYACAGSQKARAAGFGMPYLECDGSDFFSVYETAGEAIAHARSGKGPIMVHVHLARWYGHFEGDAMTYRANGEVAKLRAEKDCLVRFRKQVEEFSLLEAADLDAIDGSVRAEIEAAVIGAKAAPVPEPAELLEDVYVNY
ncbi:thiamine pyrophosphate-dependent dehydrogenase E1 component subunit alpha [Acidomonas methanolica]|uniref:Pyruvate dehydrogenase E1 component alpha subunit n=1 Tax=Acidomonas methanolica NBRC 104435 TaxID=1231351 RepID=A0A023D616_ACIMT|nr:thiamine pyrophosphate-dependent dehydrogenase E1 component subunit alpha [Acidomonas methanolica]MBU2655215.1 thiamine pyrophosphate-dependent dehydrogenase E1 component subunit alpha [Acidomonas methanolica]TCS25615.1 pyruvate dehydrogenase E1 component alpha subunit [Acidomonas methanolica]GAJ29539.1 pyruvate dehydrogenase E1 component alpha subunit [Acidomonas methanolica NBRC 104435]GBQ51394.1 pyruvate dehydrogenase E1 component subunit alpha [Acidomonas methanolica]GEK98739.1 dehydrog